jgi:hypothetical protein
MIDNHNNKMMFNNAWACTPYRFERLRSFCGGLATVFTNTASDVGLFHLEMGDGR